ncbi:hypothetical protein ABPG72_007549 [Tetrahymena utriculariae]
MSLPSQRIFDPDQFTQQQTENLINEDYQDGISSILRQGQDSQHDLQQIFYPSRPNTHFVNQGQIFQSTQQQQQQNVIQPMQVLTNGEFLKQQMANPMLIKSIKDKYSSYNPTLRLTMIPLDQNDIELDEEDLLGVFERFGSLEVKLEQGGKALLEFKDIYGAYFAWNSLNGVEIPSQKVSIGLDWLYESQKQQQNFPLNTLSNAPPISLNVGNYTPNSTCSYNKNIQNENMHTSQNLTQQPNSVLKQANSNFINTPSSSSSIRTSDVRSNNQNLIPVSKGQNQTIQPNIIKNQPNQIQSHSNILGGTCQNSNTNVIAHQNQLCNPNQAREGQNNSSCSSTSLSNNYGGNNTMNNQNGSQNSNNNNQINANNANNIKYTCRYEIQISNDKDFQVARKIIGSRGENMKAIIKKCLDHNKKKGGYNLQNDDEHGVKLRLRGKGSGYKEGPEKQESQEALHLCVSSMYYNMYKSACYFVEELLQNIYDEYYKMCQQNNLKRERVHIKKQESTNGKGGQTISTVPQQQYQQQQQPQQQQSQALNQIPANPMQQQQSSTQNLQQIHSNNSVMSGSNTQKQNNLQQQQVQYLPINKSQQNNSNQLNSTSPKDAQNTNTTINNNYNNNNNNNNNNNIINNNSDNSLNNQIKYEKIIPFQTDKTFEQLSNTQQSQGENQVSFSSNEDLEKNSYENSFIQNSNENDSDSPSSANLNNRYESYGYIHLQNPNNSKMSEKQIISLIEQRNKARKESNFQEADRIRNFLKNNGIALMDEKGGRGKGQDVTTWKYSKSSNPQQQQQLQNSPNASKSNNINKQNNNQQQAHLQQQIQSQITNNTHSIVNTNNINN